MAYNGWTNYETWNLMLWISNDQWSEGYWNEAAEDAMRNNDNDKDAAAIEVAERLEEETRGNSPEVSGFYADVLGAAMSEVNYREIAEHMVDDVEVDEPQAVTE